MQENEQLTEKRYTLATRDVDIPTMIVTAAMIVAMIVWACLTEDKRLLFIPLFFLAVLCGCLIVLIFRLCTEPKIAIQADVNGIHLFYPKNKEVFIPYSEITEVAPAGIRNVYGRIVVHTKDNKYRSIRTYEPTDRLLNPIRRLVEATYKEEYLIRISSKVRGK